MAIAAIGLVAITGHALAAVRDRAVRAWIDRVVAARVTLASWAPPPPPPSTITAPLAPSSPAHHVRRASRVDLRALEPDERLDAIRASFCPEAARLLCDARRRCGCGYAEPDCLERVEAACSNQLFTRYERDAEHLELDVGVRDRCLDGFADLPTHCELTAAVVHGCGLPVRDVAAIDEPCESHALRCRDGVCSAEGRCEPLPRAYEPTWARVCGLDDVRGTTTCLPATNVGGACDEYVQCGEGRFDCLGNRCMARFPYGSPCSASWQCDTGLVCASTDGDPVYACRSAPVWCTDDRECGSEQSCLPRPSTCRDCEHPDDCVGRVRCDDGHWCNGGTECDEGNLDEGQCQPAMCPVQRLESLFEMT